MKIQVLGPGCAKCRKQYDQVTEAVAASGIAASVEKVDRIDQIMKFGIMLTPAIVIDGEVVTSGKVLSADEIVDLLRDQESGSVT